MNKKDAAAQQKAVPSEREHKVGKKIRWKRILAVLLILILLVVLIGVLFPKLLNTDRVVRFFRYMGLRDREDYGHMSFDANASNAYAGFDNGLLIGSESGVTLLSLDGEQKAFVQGSMPTPVIRSGDEISICFSPGSSYYAVIGAGGKTLIDRTINGSFLDAAVSDDGYLCCLTSESGYKAVATVMNRKQETVFRFSSRTRYLNACAVSEGGVYLAVASLGEKDSIYQSGLTILRTDEALTDLDAEGSSAVKVDLGNEVIYHLEFLDSGHICAIGQSNVTFLDLNGTVLGTVPVSEQKLSDYARSSDGYLILCLSMDGTGTKYRVLTLDAKGAVLGERVISERVYSVSASGKYTAVLTEQRMDILDNELVAYASVERAHGASRAICRADGTALLINTNSAELYIP